MTSDAMATTACIIKTQGYVIWPLHGFGDGCFGK